MAEKKAPAKKAAAPKAPKAPKATTKSPVVPAESDEDFIGPKKSIDGNRIEQYRIGNQDDANRVKDLSSRGKMGRLWNGGAYEVLGE